MWKDEFAHFGQSSCQFNTSRPCTDYDEGHQLVPLLGVIGVQCLFKTFQHLVAVMQSFCCSFERHGMFSHFIVAEIIGIASGSYNQIVVIQTADGGGDLFFFRMYLLHFTYTDMEVFVSFKYLAEWE